MRGLTLVDTGPFVAFLNAHDAFHGWATRQFANTTSPLLTCEAVVTEAWFIAGRMPGARDAVLELVARNVVKIAFRLDAEIDAVVELTKRYGSIPMSLADACLVRMAETNPGSVLLTLDGDFRVYRMNRRRVIPVRMPSDE